MGDVCYGIVKYLVVLVNFLVWLFGICVVILAIWALIDPTFYISMAQDQNHYYISTYILLIIGILLVTVAFLGCCGAFKESQCMLLSFFCVLLVVLVAQLATAIWAYVNADTLEPMIRSTIKMTVNEDYKINESRRTTFDTIQKSLKCCGAERPHDWATNKVSIGVSSPPDLYDIPESCCVSGIPMEACHKATRQLKVGAKIDTYAVYQSGCIEKVIKVLKDNASIIVMVGLGVMLLEVCGLLFSLVLIVTIKRSGRYKA